MLQVIPTCTIVFQQAKRKSPEMQPGVNHVTLIVSSPSSPTHVAMPAMKSATPVAMPAMKSAPHVAMPAMKCALGGGVPARGADSLQLYGLLHRRHRLTRTPAHSDSDSPRDPPAADHHGPSPQTCSARRIDARDASETRINVRDTSENRDSDIHSAQSCTGFECRVRARPRRASALLSESEPEST